MKYSEINDIKILYHYTDSKNKNSIQRNGLSPKFSNTGPYIYLAADIPHALGYYGHNDEWESGILYSIKVSDLDENLLGPDDDDLPDIVGEDWINFSWRESIEASGQCTYSGIILPKYLKIIKSYGKYS